MLKNTRSTIRKIVFAVLLFPSVALPEGIGFYVHAFFSPSGLAWFSWVPDSPSDGYLNWYDHSGLYVSTPIQNVGFDFLAETISFYIYGMQYIFPYLCTN
ncbi:hypothetical protein [Endozoicomonas euniceicola]|uniref:Uncharacterized protein n=1 Tax=Endozoicomonas euniceicola TaxID=1234143 RepID=A0ABY6GZ99_9GAMM|nr:hypothetical protein [Endozoicomonas euniceicola]UYM18128.1 hypothetical protein NX720_09545 [Endozoicomonas euniceicola]